MLALRTVTYCTENEETPSMHRANAAQGEPNVNQVRLLAEMPVRVF